MRNLKILKFQKSEILKTYQYYSGNFPCTRFNCLGCPHQLIAGQTVTGFPFELEEQIGKGGFESV